MRWNGGMIVALIKVTPARERRYMCRMEPAVGGRRSTGIVAA
jgi:hypothetical protein